MNLQETIRRILREVRVPRNERVELYKDDNIIVVVPLTHRALQKYAHRCLWCINDDKGEWEDYHKGKHAVIIQRNPKKPKIGITGNPTASEIFLLAKWDNNQSSFEDVCQMLDYEFRNDRTMSDYYVTISNDINNFATNIVYYSPENGVYDQEDNFLWNFNIEINDIPNVKPKVIEIMDDYLQENEEMNLQENIRRILREELSLRVRRRIDPDEMEKEFLESFDSAYDLTKKRKVLSRHFLDELISTIIIMMMEAFHWRFDSTLPEDEFWYDDIHTELENHYRDRITQMYNEIRGINKSIIREELHSPAGDKYKPGRYVVHKSQPHWRENIELTGLQTSVGDCYQVYAGGGVKCKKAIFATDSLNEKDMFDSTYDDDIWIIDTECAGVSWFKDKHYFKQGDNNYHIVTFKNISPDCLELIHEGTGKSW